MPQRWIVNNSFNFGKNTLLNPSFHKFVQYHTTLLSSFNFTQKFMKFTNFLVNNYTDVLSLSYVFSRKFRQFSWIMKNSNKLSEFKTIIR